MIVLRNKFFTGAGVQVQQPQRGQTQARLTGYDAASKQLMIEQMKQQRQLVQTIRMREKIQAEERKEKLRMIQRAQKAEIDEKKADAREIMKASKEASENEGPKNVNLYKTRSTVLSPVPMKH